ncbi:MAG: peptidylprolyl isomerase [Myxococcaceae bacterium]|nr:peptidylprolyl isomerase [Myxococcaceae bacterium]
MSRAIACLCLIGCASTLRQISELEDRRDGPELLPYLQAHEPKVRQRALLALARVQDPASAPAVARALKDVDSEVRDEAAFAAGLLGLSWQPLDDETKALLVKALLDAKETPRVLEALGRLGAVEPLTARAAASERAALALGIALKRGGKLTALPAELPVTFGHNYLRAMSRLPEGRVGLIEGLRAPDPELRAISAKGLGETGGADEALLAALNDPDVRVAVEAVRALIKLKVPLPPKLDRAPVALAALQAGAIVDTDAPGLECRVAIARDRAAKTFAASKGCGPLALHELEAEPDELPKGSAELLGALDAIGKVKAQRFVPQIRPLLSSDDHIVAAGAAVALAKLGDRASIPALRSLATRVLSHEDIAPSVADALTELDAKEAVPELTPWLATRNATVRHTAAAALTKLTGARVIAPEQPQPDADPLPDTGSGLKLITARGEIELVLWNDEHPRTAGNLWSLAKKGYFDGQTFHRIVPDFVAQGGDPRGDGEGGPGYLIRCEIGHRPYVRGTVGMALSGKDTGGSQFFITHTAVPHLDGRYTAFGQVTKGMDVVDALLEGDRILKVEALP